MQSAAQINVAQIAATERADVYVLHRREAGCALASDAHMYARSKADRVQTKKCTRCES
jgi:hypothetical protein